MIPLRITDPAKINPLQVAKLHAERGAVAIQFSEPGYTREMLQEIDALCKQYGAHLEVRFYSHYSKPFDFSALRNLPSVINLSIDCMQHAENFEVLGELKNLKLASIGIEQMDYPAILSLPSLRKIEGLRLGDTNRHPVDLSPIAEFTELRDLHVTGNAKGLSRISAAPKLKRLSLGSIKNYVKLAFINKMEALKSLQLLLGGRTDISEVAHVGLKSLNIIRVMGFKNICLDSFPMLEELEIEDQIRLMNIHFPQSNKHLKKIFLLNCKALEVLSGLPNLRNLEHLRISRSSIDFDLLSEDGFPPKLRIFAFYDKSKPKSAMIRQKLDEMGYSEWGNPRKPNS